MVFLLLEHSSGIFIAPSTIIRHTESAGLSLLVWVIGALIAFLGSLCYIELGTSIREAGCDFAYICYVKWYSIAFSFMWVSVLMTYPATIAVISETFGQYLLEGLRQTYVIDPKLAPIAQKCFGITLLWLITWMNFFALGKFAARFQIAATFAKLLACSIIILTGFYYYFVLGWNEGLKEPMANSKWNAGDLTMGICGGLYAYSGWDILNYGTDEIDRPRRNAPLALLSGILIVFLAYFCINIAYFAVLDVETMKSSNAVAALFSQKTLGGFSEAIPFLIGILLIGSLNSNLFCGSRHLPACFSCVNSFHESPRVASALAVAISFVGDLDALIGYVMFGFWAQRIFTLCALLVIRHHNIPVHPDCIRIPLPLIYLFLAISVALVAVPIWREFAITSLGICICLIGFAFYLLFSNYSKSRETKMLSALNEKSTFFAQLIFNAEPTIKHQPFITNRQPSLLLCSDSQRELLIIESDRLEIVDGETEDLSNSTTVDLHSDEKNTLIRNSSSSGLRMW
uniref:Amino acid transporter n=1 Tax=Meloidogyne incognita TaxID=6306 RepID=A0A914L9P1_MELIC